MNKETAEEIQYGFEYLTFDDLLLRYLLHH